MTDDRPLRRPPACLHCGYSLEGVDTGPCPECGKVPEHEPADAAGMRAAVARFGGAWRYGRIAVVPGVLLWLGDRFYWSDVHLGGSWQLAVFIACAIGVSSLAVGFGVSRSAPKLLRTPVMCFVADSMQWLLWVPLLMAAASFLALPIQDAFGTSAPRFRFVREKQAFFSAVALAPLMVVAIGASIVMRCRAQAVASRFGFHGSVQGWSAALGAVRMIALIAAATTAGVALLAVLAVLSQLRNQI